MKINRRKCIRSGVETGQDITREVVEGWCDNCQQFWLQFWLGAEDMTIGKLKSQYPCTSIGSEVQSDALQESGEAQNGT